MTSLLAPRALARAVVLLALALLAAAPAQAQLRTYQVRWLPQGTVAADGYDLHLRLDGSSTWSVLDLGFVATNTSGLASYSILLNDMLTYDLAIRAYVLDGATKLSSPLSNVVEVVALEEAVCAVDADCSDQNVCNGTERCVSGLCSAGTALVCADPGPCQAAVCDAVEGCVVVDDPADPACQPDPDPDPDPDPVPDPDPDPTPAPQAGTALDLDGAGEQLGTSGAATLGIATEFTLSMWVKPTGAQRSQYLFEAFSPGTTEKRSAILVVTQNEKANDPVALITYNDSGTLLQLREYNSKQRAGEWLHIVMVQTPGGDHLHAYFNGVAAQANEVKADGSGSMTDRPREIVIGTYFTRLQSFFSGSVGHVALWNKQLTAAEVAEIYARGHEIDLRSNSGAYVSAPNLRHYWRLGQVASALGRDFAAGTRVPLSQTVGLDASDIVPFVTAECSVHADCSDGNACNGTERCSAGTCSTGSALVCADPGPCQAAVCDAVQGCVVVDDPADPACQPDPEPDPGPAPDPQLGGVSLDLDGVGEQLGTSGAARLGIATEFTLSMWVKPTGAQRSQYLFEAFSPGTTEKRSAILVVTQNEKANDPVALITYNDSGTLLQLREYNSKQRAGEWLHIVMVQTPGGDHLHAYFNGLAAQANEVKADGSGSMTDRLREIVIGTYFTRLLNFFDGSVGHVALWNKQLTAAEVAEIYARGHEIDLRSNSGAYVSASRLRHYWRPGEIPSALGTDFVPSAPVPLDQTVGLGASDVVPSAP